MKKPENFNKVDNEQIIVGSKKLTIDVANDGFFVMDNGTTDWNNVVLFEMDWDKEQYNVKICVVGEGTDGWYLHEKLPIPKAHMLTVERFKDFAISNMYDVANKVDLKDVRPNMMGMTDITMTEIKHIVPSSSGPNTTYEVTENAGGIAGEWTCTCPAYQYSKATPQTCKHINSINT
jgi:hypothetical protein